MLQLVIYYIKNKWRFISVHKVISLAIISISIFLSPSLLAYDDIYKVPNYVSKKGLVIYSAPKAGSKTIATIPPNTSWIKIQGRVQAGWQKIAWNGQQGWIKAGSIILDRAATNIADKKTDCLHDPSVKNKTCCGIVETTSDPSELVKIYSVTGVAKNDLLMMNSSPGKKENIVSLIPHNATWIMKLGKKSVRNGIVWEKIKWGGTTGWVDGRKIQFSPGLTAVNDTKRKACNKQVGCEPDLSAALGRNKLR